MLFVSVGSYLLLLSCVVVVCGGLLLCFVCRCGGCLFLLFGVVCCLLLFVVCSLGYSLLCVVVA